MTLQTFIEAGNELPDAEVLAGIRELIDARFSGYATNSVRWMAEDIDPLLCNMIADLPDESNLPSYEAVVAAEYSDWRAERRAYQARVL